jgi:hypothetical protein
MKQEEINKDLGSYIHERKDRPFWKKHSDPKIKPKLKEDEMESAIKEEIEHVKTEEQHTLTQQDKHELESMEKHVEEINEAEQVYEEKADVEREGVLKKFFKKLNFSDKKEKNEEKEYEPAVMSNNPEITMDDEETRELLHGLHNWIIQLPADKLEQFKNSKEFELYTKYLRKHSLIK